MKTAIPSTIQTALPFSSWAALAVIAVALFSSGLSQSADHSQSLEITESQREFFEKKIRPLFVEHCYQCHDSSSDKLKGGLAINSPSAFRSGGDSGPAFIPGKPEESLLIEAIHYQNRDLQMPPKTPLPARAIKDLEAWVKMGAPDPRPDDPTAKLSSGGMSPEEGRDFWSFRELKNPKVPAETHPVDFFLDRKLKESSLPASEQASRETWIRRVTFDLIGLPPTPDEVRAFVADDSPDANTKVVDRLLSSPDYGVRWGRHWLDVARYADSNGLDENLAFAQAWRYRDWVMDSFRDDRPFDEFLIHQIAGDLIEEPTLDSLTATGFLALGARVLAEPDMEKLEMDVIDEQIDTTGKAFLGLTLGCARCHDHKFDPILQSDYYSLAAILKNSRNFSGTNTGAIKHWYEHDFATEGEKPKLKEWDDKIAVAKKKASSMKSTTTVKLRGIARSKSVQYLEASLEFEPDDTLATVTKIAGKFDLHPRILYHCRRHLENHQDDVVFGPWWKFRKEGDVTALRDFYDDHFGRAILTFDALRKKDAKAKELPDKSLEPFRAALFQKDGFLAVPAKAEHAFNEKDLAEYHKLAEEARIIESHAPDHPSAMGIAEADEFVETLPIHIRGSYLNLGDPVPRAVPAVFTGELPQFPEEGSGRLELAKWMAHPDHPLTSRVIVNRVWRWHFGTGLVSTTENFGVLGDRPSHPELLDFLATWFVENGWSIKKLNRLLVLSDAYQRRSSPAAGYDSDLDPDNRLLAWFPVKRLEAESVRDAILAVSGRLDREFGGKTIPLRNRMLVFNHTSKDHTTYESLRRTAYLPVIRNHVFDWMYLFDYPDPTMPTGDRNSTVIAPQALLMMNSDLSIDSAEAFASRVKKEAKTTPERIEKGVAACSRSHAIQNGAERSRKPFSSKWNQRTLPGHSFARVFLHRTNFYI